MRVTRKEIQDAVCNSRLQPNARLIVHVLCVSKSVSARAGKPAFVASTSLVAQWASLSRSATAEYLVALERAGWIERTPSEWHIRIGAPECRLRETIPPEVRSAVFERDGHACVSCSAADDLTLDHVRAWSAGGSDAPDNLRVLCRPCNSRKGARAA